MKRMAEVGLMSSDPAEAKALELFDPYQLRAEGLDAALPLPRFGRALFHLNQRRGFRSNCKADRGDNESGKIKDATKRLDEEMAIKNARTYGEFLHMRRAKAPNLKEVPTVRTRMRRKKKPGMTFTPTAVTCPKSSTGFGRRRRFITRML